MKSKTFRGDGKPIQDIISGQPTPPIATDNDTQLEVLRKELRKLDVRVSYEDINTLSDYCIDKILEVFDKFQSIVQQEAVDNYIQVQLGWIEANKDNLKIEEIIATFKGQMTDNG